MSSQFLLQSSTIHLLQTDRHDQRYTFVKTGFIPRINISSHIICYKVKESEIFRYCHGLYVNSHIIRYKVKENENNVYNFFK